MATELVGRRQLLHASASFLGELQFRGEEHEVMVQECVGLPASIVEPVMFHAQRQAEGEAALQFVGVLGVAVADFGGVHEVAGAGVGTVAAVEDLQEFRGWW